MNREDLELVHNPSNDFVETSTDSSHPSSLGLPSFTLHYRVAMPQPESHLFEVTLQVRGWQRSTLDLKMPVWTPGSYLVREYRSEEHT